MLWSAAQRGEVAPIMVESGGQAPAESEDSSSTEAAVPERVQAAPSDKQQPLDGSEVPANPLVAAFTESLAARGHSVENQGLIVETLKGEVLAEHNADKPFNPASVVKMATSLVAIAKFGPDFRYRTYVYTDGTFNPKTGTVDGSVYVIGSGDPAFFYENALLIIDQLNHNGIYSVNGNLVVQGQFYFNFSASPEASARAFRAALNPETWGAETKNAYQRFLTMKSSGGALETRARTVAEQTSLPSLRISGETIVDPAINTSSLRLLAVHTSLPLIRVLKVLNDFSNNWMATAIGQRLGGPEAVDEFLEHAVGLKNEETRIVTASGLGANSISPRGTTQILRKLMVYLEREGLRIEDLLPIAGVDAGTLQRRFTDQFRASVVGKTGTLQGVSALAGVAYTRGKGPLLFVIYNRGGSAASFRAAQDETLRKLITLYGGPAPLRLSTFGVSRSAVSGSSQR